MAGDKSLEFGQFARVALDGGDANPASQTEKANNQGTELLADGYGRLWAHVVGANGNGPFMTRAQVGVASIAQNLNRQLITGAGLVESCVLSLFNMKAQRFGNDQVVDDLVYVQIHDVVGLPAANAVPLVSLPIQGNRQIMSIGMGIVVAAGASLVLSKREAFFSVMGNFGVNNGRTISQAVIFT